MILKIVCLAFLLLFAAFTVVATAFRLTIPKKLWGIEDFSSRVFDRSSIVPLGEIDNPGGP